MSQTCPACGYDAQFEVAFCPSCGRSLDSAQPPEQAFASASADDWEKTVVEPSGASAGRASRRARFDRGPEFYEPIDDRTAGFGAAGAATSDETVLERRPAAARDDETVIVRAGRHRVEGPLAYLVERAGIRAGKVHLLSTDCTIGRTADNAVVLDNSTVSKHHAKVRAEEGKFLYWDLASANHSHLVGPDRSRRRILEPHPLTDGDTIDLGDARVTFLLVDDDGLAPDAS
jgi:hypothetical protein